MYKSLKSLKILIDLAGFQSTVASLANSTMFCPTDASIANSATGLPAAVKSVAAQFAVSDLNAAINSLNAQIASLNVQLAAAKSAQAAAEAATAKANADAATAKAASDVAAATAAANAANASTKAVADAVAAKDAEIKVLKDENAKALAALKDAFNALAKKWNAKNPKAKVTLVK